jgi:hypothetical protein
MKLTIDDEEKVFSQNGEDGIIRTIFKIIGTTSRQFLEIGIEDGKECNTRNLLKNYGWSGTMVEGNKENCRKAQEFYKGKQVNVIQRFITADTIGAYCDNNLDLLSIDVDGNDYWLWEAVEQKPRVVVIEYNASLLDKAITIPYNPDFVRKTPKLFNRKLWLYYGAGLNALISLGKKKGYKLVYANGVNAFFVDKDILGIDKLSFKEAYRENAGRRVELKNNLLWIGWGLPQEQFDLIKQMKFVRV